MSGIASSFKFIAWSKRLLALLTLLIAAPLAQAGLSVPGPLVSADWLAENLENVVVLDVRKDTESFTQQGHIAGAVLVNAKQVRVKRVLPGLELTRMLPRQEQHEAFMAKHGVSNDSVVVITHEGKKAGHVAGAARLYWQMKYYGFEQLALLDGGNPAWQENLEELVTESSPVEPGNFQVTSTNPQILATTADVVAAINEGQPVLVDTRPLRFHIGIDQRDYVYAAGHLPGSRLFDYNFMHPEKGIATFLPGDRLRDAMRALHIDPDAPAILYCNSGYEASSVWFLMHEVLGNQSVRLYDGSLHEWTKDESRPMVRALAAPAGLQVGMAE
jgi:thiosulfate/3-mercaptopyruvate sulfurtransferase